MACVLRVKATLIRERVVRQRRTSQIQVLTQSHALGDGQRPDNHLPDTRCCRRIQQEPFAVCVRTLSYNQHTQNSLHHIKIKLVIGKSLSFEKTDAV